MESFLYLCSPNRFSMAIKAAFFDIDGTLVSFQTHQIPASTIKAIEQAKERGVKIFISTGRPVAIINNIDPIRHLIDGYITFNGARTFIGDEDITLMPIPEEEVRTMITDASRRNYAVVVCGKEDIGIHNHTSIFDDVFVRGLGVTNIDIHQPNHCCTSLSFSLRHSSAWRTRG